MDELGSAKYALYKVIALNLGVICMTLCHMYDM